MVRYTGSVIGRTPGLLEVTVGKGTRAKQNAALYFEGQPSQSVFYGPRSSLGE